MDWIFDHFQFVIVFVGAFIWWLNKRRESSEAADEEAQQRPPPLVLGDTDYEEAARVRRIQEEIRRKIAERRTLPPMVLFERTEPSPPPVMETRWDRTPAPQLDTAADAALLEQQRQLAEKFRMIEEASLKAPAARPKSGVLPVRRVITSAKPDTAPAWLISGLRDNVQVRRAIVLREILGTPKGLQP